MVRKKKDPFAAREAKKYTQPIVSREYILEFLQSYKGPCTFEALQKKFGLRKPEKVEALRRRLVAMVRDGQLVINRREGYMPVNDRDLLRGRVIAHADGYGFLQLEEGGDDLFIPAHQMRTLLHGDRVVMRITGIGRRGKTEVALVDVLERANQRLVGRLHIESQIAFVIADNKRITQEILIPVDALKGAQHGQIVIVDIVEQPTRHHQPIGRISSVLGERMAPGMEIDIAIHSHNLACLWPDGLDEEIAGLDSTVKESDKKNRTDFTHLPFVTIDGIDAKDFDDAVYCEPKGAGWRLLVAIADVSHYVKPGTILDEEAYRRSTSVYFPGRVLPMLPEVLSNGLCSLNPQVDRLCMVCDMRISEEGVITAYQFWKGVIRSRARLIYDEVAAFLQNSKAVFERNSIDLTVHLQNLQVLYRVLQKARNVRGAIDFDSVETRIVFGAGKKLEAIQPVLRNDAHRLIEECMIAANIAAASFLTKNKIPGLYRIHETPQQEKVDDLKMFLGELGITFSPKQKPTAKTYANLLKKIRERLDARLIETVLLRSLSQAVYSPDNAGHFGLALSQYAHFTSPIRRYPDLLVHRAITHILQGGKVVDFNYNPTQMRLMGEHCSMGERRADEATRDAMDWLKCEYMLDKVGQVFMGLITGVTSFGLFVELNDVFVEGLVHVSALGDEFYHFDPKGHKLTGERSGKIYRLADAIQVSVAKVNLDEREIDLEPVLKNQRKRNR